MVHRKNVVQDLTMKFKIHKLNTNSNQFILILHKIILIKLLITNVKLMLHNRELILVFLNNYFE